MCAPYGTRMCTFSVWLHEEAFKTFLLNALNWKQGSYDDACDRLSKSIINHKCM